MRRERILLALILGLVCICGTFLDAAELVIVQQFEDIGWSTPTNAVDIHVVAALGKQGIKLRNPCSDVVFIRRVYLDVIGTLPVPSEVEAFLKDPRPDKRTTLVENLLGREEFVDYWTMKWCDLLRVKSEFPINLWPNAVQAYNRWIHDAIRQNRPYNQFVQELLTSSGSNFRVPQVNFYRALQGRDSASIAEAVALTFMGVRSDRWPKARRDEMALFFSKVAYKNTKEWKEEIVYVNPEMTKSLKAIFPDGTAVMIPADADPRKIFANWLTNPNNKWFNRNIVNRIWAWTMGYGIINEPDDIRPDNPPACPELLAYLEKELISSNYDLRHIYRLILNSHTYQQSSIPNNDTKNPKVQFAHYTVRQLDAEVLVDALCWIGGDGESYSSPIPEPFTFIPKDQRTITLADGSITSSFLTIYGRPSRDTGLFSERSNQPKDSQRLYLLNSSDVQRRIQQSPQLQAAYKLIWNKPSAAIDRIYLIILSRHPMSAELDIAMQYLKKSNQQQGQTAVDLAWVLINSKEFLCRH